VPNLLPLRPELQGAEPYGAPHPDVPIRLNVNENPYPPPPAAARDIVERVRAAVSGVNRYPDRDFPELRSRLAAYLGQEAGAPFLTPENMWAANGSNEVMVHVFEAFAGPGRTGLSAAPTYSMYPEYARDTFTRWVTVPRRPDFSLDLDAVLAAIERERPTVIVLASPNNPTGTHLPLDQIEAILEAVGPSGAKASDAGAPAGSGGAASAVVVIDEAYAEFRRPGTPSAVTLLPRYPHLAVSRTMSKAFAFAGVRLGYLAAAPELVQALRTVRLPYHLSALTQAAAVAALDHAPELLERVAELRGTRDRLVAALRAMTNPATGRPLDVADSDSNFVLFGTFPDRHAVFERLLERGIIIREVGPDGWLRVSVGTPEETDAFLTALAAILPTLPAVPAPPALEKEGTRP
jgi:histidinol-phosphate aminotransferase